MSTTKSVYFFFVDGIGIGPGGSANPFDTDDLPGFKTVTGGQLLVEGQFQDVNGQDDNVSWLTRAIDANLDVEGLPQSGTGQATLFTGVNCAKVAGRHYGPFPHSSSRPILKERSLFARIGPEDAAFANAYPKRFFEWAQKRNRWSTTTRCCLESGVRIRTLEDLRDGTAIAADLTGKGLADIAASPIPLLDEDSTAQRIAELTRTHRLVVSEYFHTDKAGHAQDPIAAKQCLIAIDRFLAGLVSSLDFRNTTLVIASDHGNMEDLSVKSHTRYPVPLIVAGPGWRHFQRVEDLTGVAEAIMSVLEE